MADGTEPTKISDLMQAAVSAKSVDKEQLFARQCWNRIAGSSELKHTCATYLTPVKPPHKLPVLIVYIDSPSLVVEYGTDKLLYQARLEEAGLNIRAVDFKLSKNAAAHARALRDMEKSKSSVQKSPQDACRDLSSEEREHIASMVTGLPDGVAQALSGAMAASLKRGRTSTPREPRTS
jgi:hypothetical protein